MMKRFLKQKRITVTKLAESIGYSQPYISQVLKGTRPATNAVLSKIAKRLRMPISSVVALIKAPKKKG